MTTPQTRNKLPKRTRAAEGSGYRPGTTLPTYEINIFFTGGGLGDYICWIPGLFKFLERSPQMRPHFWLPDYFIPLFRNYLRERNLLPKNTIIRERKEITEEEVSKRPGILPNHLWENSINATGMNLVECGHVLFNRQFDYEREYSTYPLFNHRYRDVPALPSPVLRLKRHNKKFFVLTTTSSAPSRTLGPDVLQKVSEYLVSRGYYIVLLGNTDFKAHDPIVEREVTGLPVINLINQTPLDQAAHIIAASDGILGLDNGLLHLAATTPVPQIFFAYTVASPTLREPIPAHPATRVHNILPGPSLHCRFCQDNMRYFPPDHTFTKCLYKDYKCIDMMDENVFIEALKKQGV